MNFCQCKTILFSTSLFLFFGCSSSFDNALSSLKRVYPISTFATSDSCDLKNIKQLTLVFFNRKKEDISVYQDSIFIDKASFFGINEEQHSVIDIQVNTPFKYLYILNNSRKKYFLIPYNSKFDVVGINWKNEIQLEYGKSCNELYK